MTSGHFPEVKLLSKRPFSSGQPPTQTHDTETAWRTASNRPSWGLCMMPVVCLTPQPQGSTQIQLWVCEAQSTSGWRLAHHQPACTLPGAQVAGDAERCRPGCGARADGQAAPAPGLPLPRRPPPPERRRHCRAGPPHSTHSRLWENCCLHCFLRTVC